MPRTPLGGDGRLRRSVAFEAERLLRRETRSQGERLRELRLRQGLTQADVARAVGVSRSVVCELEQGDPGVSLTVRARAALLLGARLRLQVYNDGTPLLHDRAHSRIAERIVAACHPRWDTMVEAPVPGPGHRSTDIRLVSGTDVVLVEVETVVRRWEELARELHVKRASVLESFEGRARVHVVLAIPPTRDNRSLVAALPTTVRSVFPVRSHDLMSALTGAGPGWPGDGILWIAAGVEVVEQNGHPRGGIDA